MQFEQLLKKHSYLNRFHVFQNLMQCRIREILLVSSLYDSFILEEEGQLYEMIHSQYHAMNLSQAPSLTRVSNGAEAIEMVSSKHRFDLIITTPNLSDMSATEFAQLIAQSGQNVPVVLMTYDSRELVDLASHCDMSVFEKAFIWQGDHRILISIIKYIEDRLNVAYDSGTAGVQIIILIEDNEYFYSSYLPLIHSELFRHSQSLLSEGINISHKILRMRARPKILLCSTYEEAWGYYKTYEDCILGVIADLEFPCEGELDPEAGFKFARQVRESHFDIPVLLQSDSPDLKKRAAATGASFLVKTSPTLLHDLQKFMKNNLSFGDFVFRLPDGSEVERAHDLRSLERKLHTIPDESLRYHSEMNHFSTWLKARTEFWLAHKLRPRRVPDFESLNSLRQHLIDSLHDFRKQQYLGNISDFNADTFDTRSGFARIGSGSLGGKARGLGFANTLLSSFKVSDLFEGVRISVPPSVVLATDVFDQFLDDNHLLDSAIKATDDERIVRRFMRASFRPEIMDQLKAFLDLIRYPLAVRSSSLLEDSRYLPFAGIYDTFMLSNSHQDGTIRLEELQSAIKRVYASTYCEHAKAYIKSSPYRLEEEKMAVIIQKLVGSRHRDRFYPTFSGVVRSHNFYPLPPMTSSDGIASVGLGLGQAVVEQTGTVRFCPKYPRHLAPLSNVSEVLANSQKEFYALRLEPPDSTDDSTRKVELEKFSLKEAEEDGTLDYVGSTYSLDNNTIYEGTSRSGVRLVTFAPILKSRLLPLPGILELFMEMGSWGMNTPVEVEFAADLTTPPGVPKEFAFLQLRPMVKSHELDDLEVDDVDCDNLVCQSHRVLGNGTIENIHDIIMVDKGKYDRSRSFEVAAEIKQFNSELAESDIPYLLIGVGRWGSADPWLGIQVSWDEISGARVIVETGFRDLKVEPSQGTHFFQNLTSFRVGYFTVDESCDTDFVDWSWLQKQPAVAEKEYVRHLHFAGPVIVKMNGHSNKGIIIKPGAGAD